MRIAEVFTFAAILCLGPVATAHCIELSVSVVAENPPSQITVNVEGDNQLTALSRNNPDGVFKTTLTGPESGTDELVIPYRLAAYWTSATEQLYLGIRPLRPMRLNLYVYHEAIGSDDVALRKIEGLGSDLISLLRKYFWARAFHYRCRYEDNLPLHSAAIRSARLWYDASVNLAKMPESIFRMDDDIAKIMHDYEDLAKTDKSFAKCYRKYVLEGYVRGTDAQLVGQNYGFVGKIPELVSKGHIEEARELNSRALAAFSSESKETQRVIRAEQQINKKLLMDNARYIDTLQSLK